jgi:hypothetical protein
LNVTLDRPAVFQSRPGKIVDRLQIDPEFRARAEEARQPQRRVRRHRLLALDDGADGVAGARNATASAFTESPSGFRNSSASTSPGWVVTRLGVAARLVAIDDLGMFRTLPGP